MTLSFDRSALTAADLHIEPGIAFIRPCAGCGTDMLEYAQKGPVFVTADRTAVCDTCVMGIDPTMLEALAAVRDIEDTWKTSYYAGIDPDIPERADAALLDATQWLTSVAQGVTALFLGHVGITQSDREDFRAGVNERVDQMAAFIEAEAQIEADR